MHRTLALNVVHEGGEKSIIFSNQISKLLSSVTRLKIAPVFGDTARQWQIQQPGVCRPYESAVRRFSRCTGKASVCDGLTRQDATLLAQREQTCTPIP
ncbi:hypothetical protein DBR19_13605 [Aeromonas sp. HMWF014]|nr:hypothetical protein DBR19_13605 [Aeromonas sp. HMWF014]